MGVWLPPGVKASRSPAGQRPTSISPSTYGTKPTTIVRAGTDHATAVPRVHRHAHKTSAPTTTPGTRPRPPHTQRWGRAPLRHVVQPFRR